MRGCQKAETANGRHTCSICGVCQQHELGLVWRRLRCDPASSVAFSACLAAPGQVLWRRLGELGGCDGPPHLRGDVCLGALQPGRQDQPLKQRCMDSSFCSARTCLVASAQQQDRPAASAQQQSCLVASIQQQKCLVVSGQQQSWHPLSLSRDHTSGARYYEAMPLSYTPDLHADNGHRWVNQPITSRTAMNSIEAAMQRQQ